MKKPNMKMSRDSSMPNIKEEKSHLDFLTGLPDIKSKSKPKHQEMSKRNMHIEESFQLTLPLMANAKIEREEFWKNESASFKPPTKTFTQRVATHATEATEVQSPKHGMRRVKVLKDEDVFAPESITRDEFLETAKMDVQNLENWMIEKQKKEESEQEEPKARGFNLAQLELESNTTEPQLNLAMINCISRKPNQKKVVETESDTNKEEITHMSNASVAVYTKDYKKYITDVLKRKRKGSSLRPTENIHQDLNRFALNQMVGGKLKSFLSSEGLKLPLNESEMKSFLIKPSLKLATEAIGSFNCLQYLYPSGEFKDELSMEYMSNVLKSGESTSKSYLGFTEQYKSILMKNSVDPDSNVSLGELEINLQQKLKRLVQEIVNKRLFLHELLKGRHAKLGIMRRQILYVVFLKIK